MPRWLLGVAPLALVVVGLAAFALLDGPGLGERHGPPVEELAVEGTVLRPGIIELTVRNDGADPVTVAQAQVNDAFVQFSGAEEPIARLDTATVRLQQPWVEGEAYEAVLLTSAGGPRRSPRPGASSAMNSAMPPTTNTSGTRPSTQTGSRSARVAVPITRPRRSPASRAP